MRCLHDKRIRRPASLAAAAAAVCLLAVPSAARAAGSRIAAASPATPALASRVLLINGDQMLVRALPGGRPAAILLPGPRPGGLVSLRAGQQLTEVPLAAIPYLGRGLDPDLFDLNALRRARAGGRLPVRVRFVHQHSPLPGVIITRAGAHSAVGYLTPSSAARFGAALARQFRADRRGGSYGRDGMFAGGLRISLAGPQPQRPSARPDFPMHTLAVTGTDLAGRPDSGDSVWVANVTNPTAFSGVGAFYHGVAKFSVPAGQYWAVGLMGTNADARVVVLPQFTVGARTTVHLDARWARSKITISTPRPAVAQAVGFAVARGEGQDLSSIILPDSFPSLRVSLLRKKPTAGLRAYADAQLASPARAKGTAYAYNVAYADPAGLIPPQHYTVTPDSLATIRENFYQNVGSAGAWGTAGGFPAQLAPALLLPRNSAPLIQYLSAGPGRVWYSVYSGPHFSSEQAGAIQQYAARQHVTQGWGEYPLHPQPTMQLLHGTMAAAFPVGSSAIRSGNELVLAPNLFSDNQAGHAGLFGFEGRWAVGQNGHTIAGGGLANRIPAVRVSPRPSAITFRLSASWAGPPRRLSPASTTTWTWRSRRRPHARVPAGWYCAVSASGVLLRQCTVQPLLTLDYHVHGMTYSGQTSPGRQVIGLDVGHLQLAAASPVTRASAWISFTGGRIWRSAAVTRTGQGRFRIAFTAPARSRVTLRVSAADAAGGSITETILRAYAVAAGPAWAGPAAPGGRAGRPAGAPAGRPVMRRACAWPPAPGHAACLVLYRPASARPAAAGTGGGQAGRPRGLTPRQIEAAYRLPVSRRSRQTVAVSIAYDTPGLASYLSHYRHHFGLPPCTVASGCFRQVNQDGTTSPRPVSGVGSGWDLEATLDVSMISVACPHCRILVVEADNSAMSSLAASERTAGRLGAQVISNSYGGAEGGLANSYSRSYRQPGHTIVASSGDDGFGLAGPSFPADLASVTAVGGTQLSRARNARGWTERVWNNYAGASSSACSAYVPKPAWQHDPHCPGRTSVDVSAVSWNVPIYNKDYGGWVTVAGTSVSAPLIAGIYGLAGNAATVRPGYAYSHRHSLFDITAGNNAWFTSPRLLCGGDYLCTAKPGYDAPTGLGSPDGTGAF